MANRDAPNGFKPTRHLTGGTIRANEYPIATGYATSIFNQDLVNIVTDGSIELSVATTAGNIGVFAGVQYVNAAGEQVFSQYWPASTTATDIKAMVYDDPDILFAVQTGGSLAATDVGANADILTTHAGSTLTGLSGQEISGTSGTGTAQLRIHGLAKRPDNAWGTNAEVEVTINEHRHTNRTGV